MNTAAPSLPPTALDPTRVLCHALRLAPARASAFSRHPACGRRERTMLAALVLAAHAIALLALGPLDAGRAMVPELRPIQAYMIPAAHREREAAPAAPLAEVQPTPETPQPSVESKLTPAPKPKPKPVARQPAPAARAAPATVPRPSPAVAEPVRAAADELTTAAAPAPSAPAPAAAAPSTAAASASAPITAAQYDAAYLNNPPPAYPMLSRRLREQGEVMLKVLVSPAGRPTRIELARGSGSERLDNAARHAIGGWRFVPARQGEQAVEAWVLIPIVFKLQGN